MTYKIWSAVTNCLICGLGLRRNELPVGILAKLTNLLSCYCKLIRITSYKFSLPALGAHINCHFERSREIYFISNRYIDFSTRFAWSK